MKTSSRASTVLFAGLFGLSILGIAWVIVDSRRETVAVRPPEPPPIPTTAVDLGNRNREGDPSAPVVVVEFTDLECPACRTFHQTTRESLFDEFVTPSTVQWITRHLPLASIHPKATSAAIAAECAGSLGMFSPFVDHVFSDARLLDDELYRRFVKEAGGDRAVFDQCLSRPQPAIEADAALAKQFQVTGTPSFLIGSLQSNGQSFVVHRVYRGAKPLQGYRLAIEEALKLRAANMPGG